MPNKILDIAEIEPLCSRLREKGHRIGFTSGVFDILHAGHAAYLAEARKRCDILIVGINSDASVKALKGDKRPINGEKERSSLLAALESVDYIYIFSDNNNNQTIQRLKPHFYFKAGDYKPSQLSSAKYLKEWGGEAVIIPVEYDVSTSSVIDRILESYSPFQASPGPDSTFHYKKAVCEPGKAVFLDRDGVINKEVEYLGDPDKFDLLPGVTDGLKALMDQSYRLVVITNQAGIGLGYFSLEDFYRVNKKMLSLLHQQDIIIDRIYFCPHSLSDNCACRKPGIALIERARQELNLDLSSCWLIGDKADDIEAARRAGISSILVTTGHGSDEADKTAADSTCADLTRAAAHICSSGSAS